MSCGCWFGSDLEGYLGLSVQPFMQYSSSYTNGFASFLHLDERQQAWGSFFSPTQGASNGGNGIFKQLNLKAQWL